MGAAQYTGWVRAYPGGPWGLVGFGSSEEEIRAELAARPDVQAGAEVEVLPVQRRSPRPTAPALAGRE